VRPANEQDEASAPPEPEFESTDGGWDPYIAALLTGPAPARDAAGDEDEDYSEPVMSFSRRPAKFASG